MSEARAEGDFQPSHEVGEPLEPRRAGQSACAVVGCYVTTPHLHGSSTSEPRAGDDVTGLSVGALREAIINATELNGAYGKNLHESRAVILRVGGTYYSLAEVAVGFIDGSFCLILQGDE